MTFDKLLSITIPTWNRAHLLEEQLFLLSQQIIKFNLSAKVEIVISNNGSDDQTEQVSIKYTNQYNFIYYHNTNTNKGAKYNLLKALELAKGKYSIFLGDDDRYQDNGLTKMINCLEENPDVDIIFDTYLFKRNPFKDKSYITLKELLLNFYYNIGNAGLFILKTNIIHKTIRKYGYEFFSLSWPQTQIIILSLSNNKSPNILLRSLDLFSESIHDKLMMYNSYYLLRGLYFDLADAIESIKSEVNFECYYAAKKYLRNQIFQNTLNILQCGVFVDNSEQKKITITYIKYNLSKYSRYEQRYLKLIIFVLRLPNNIAKLFSNIFIFLFKGKKGNKKE